MWSRKKLEDLKAKGKIRGWKEKNSTQTTPAGRIVAKHFKKKAPALNWIGSSLLEWCQARNVVLQEEYRFDDKRKWRFDWCIPELKIAVEYEGGIHNPNGDHRSVKGISRDIHKYNRAAQLGWKVYRYSALSYKNLLNDLNNES